MALGIAALLLVAILVAWRVDRTSLAASLLDDRRTRALPVELALWWLDHAGGKGRERAAATRRSVHRIATLSRHLGLDDAASYGIQLAAALPPGVLAEADLALPSATRRALSFRHARWDGTGIPREAHGDSIPVEAQILALTDWLDARDGSPTHSVAASLTAEAGRRFSLTLASVAASRLDSLQLSTLTEAGSRFQVTDGALLCILPDQASDPDDAARAAVLVALEQTVRTMVRPTDRVYSTDQDVVVWLVGASADSALGALRRIEPVVTTFRAPGLEVGALRCVCSVALADTDATSFTDLLMKARSRARRRAA